MVLPLCATWHVSPRTAQTSSLSAVAHFGQSRASLKYMYVAVVLSFQLALSASPQVKVPSTWLGDAEKQKAEKRKAERRATRGQYAIFLVDLPVLVPAETFQQEKQPKRNNTEEKKEGRDFPTKQNKKNEGRCH